MDPAHFDHHSAAYAADPRGCVEALRDDGRVVRSDAHGGFWVLTRYEDVATVSRDTGRFSSYHDRATITGDGRGPYTGIVIPGSPTVSSFIEMDAPESLEYRRLLSKDFSPAAVEALEPMMTRRTRAALEPALAAGSFDLVNDFATAVPTQVVLEWLGLSTDRWRVFAEAQHAVAHTPPESPEFARVMDGFVITTAMLTEEIAARRADPRDDLLSRLVHAEVGGRTLQDQDVLDMLNLIISGGIDTTTSLVSCAALYLFEHPDERARLAANPALLVPAIEEFLRYFTPNQSMARTVTRDTELGGCPLAAGDRVLLFWAAANSDPEEFPAPDVVDLTRSPNRHTSFGLGPHRCLGAGFARTEARIMLETLLKVMPDYEIDVERAERYRTLGINNGYVTMPAHSQPRAARRGSAALHP